MKTINFALTVIVLLSSIFVKARNIYGYASFGGNITCTSSNNTSSCIGYYDFLLGASYKKKYFGGLKRFNDQYPYPDALLVWRNSWLYKNGLFVKAIHQINSSFYVGEEFSAIKISDGNMAGRQTVFPIYTLLVGRQNLNNTLGLELKCNYFRYTNVKSYNFVISLAIHV